MMKNKANNLFAVMDPSIPYFKETEQAIIINDCQFNWSKICYENQ